MTDWNGMQVSLKWKIKKLACVQDECVEGQGIGGDSP